MAHTQLNKELLDNELQDELMAAIDIGSNSCHLAIARLDHGEVRKIASMSEKIRLAEGLDENNILSEEAQQRGLDCLKRFAGRLESVQSHRLRIVATNTLRRAKNSDEFISKANSILPKSIEVIAGREEARLIYLGVSHTNESTDKRLVIDIGGGSTEFIIGEEFDPILTESLQMGCVTFSKQFFPDDRLTKKGFDNIKTAAKKQLLLIAKNYKKTGWSCVIGSSGTIKAVSKVLVDRGWADSQQDVTLEGVKKIEKLLRDIDHIDDLELECIKEHRRNIFPAGVAILSTIMETLGIEKLGFSEGALREGVMYDMLGRFASEDVRDRSVQALMTRYSVDKSQAQRVVTTSHQLFNQVKKKLKLQREDADLLRRSAYLYEIGLAISHSGYHKHSAYVLEHSDIPGFSRIDQLSMSLLVLNHRKKLKPEGYDFVLETGGQRLVHVCLLLRLAVIINHARSKFETIPLQLTVCDEQTWQITVTHDEEAELLLVELQEEVTYFAKWHKHLEIVK